jgi:hypothetical protein
LIVLAGAQDNSLDRQKLFVALFPSLLCGAPECGKDWEATFC